MIEPQYRHLTSSLPPASGNGPPHSGQIVGSLLALFVANRSAGLFAPDMGAKPSATSSALISLENVSASVVKPATRLEKPLGYCQLLCHSSALGSQNGPSRPIEAKIPAISLGPGRRESAVIRFPYQVSARCQICCRLMNGRRGTPFAWHHCLTVSSDRKSSMVAQVYRISSHQRAAGTAK
jgi:hypothetical protein